MSDQRFSRATFRTGHLLEILGWGFAGATSLVGSLAAMAWWEVGGVLATAPVAASITTSTLALIVLSLRRANAGGSLLAVITGTMVGYVVLSFQAGDAGGGKLISELSLAGAAITFLFVVATRDARTPTGRRASSRALSTGVICAWFITSYVSTLGYVLGDSEGRTFLVALAVYVCAAVVAKSLRLVAYTAVGPDGSVTK